MYAVYKMSIDGQSYIGSTSNMDNRITSHERDCFNVGVNRNSKKYIYIREHCTRETFHDLVKFEVLENDIVDTITARAIERNYIIKYNTVENGLNSRIPDVITTINGLVEYNREYRLQHKDSIKINKTKYYLQNKAEINHIRKVDIITCECSTTLRRADIMRHKRSKKHIKYAHDEQALHPHEP